MERQHDDREMRAIGEDRGFIWLIRLALLLV